MQPVLTRPTSPTGFRTNAAILANPSGSPSTAEDPQRLLFLRGRWCIPGSAYALNATIALGPAGAATGSIWWQAERSPAPTGIEQVRGRIAGGSVHLDGFKATHGLACDQYRITLTGDDLGGTFQGRSWAFGGWRGRMEGHYTFSRGAQV